ncbi:hypothetical protein E4U19_002832 [Claviceps sp. Clav32 group G5]|nr:hypothetical protein E4U19_002832 [Claviceps sp. Clav32 group G5]
MSAMKMLPKYVAPEGATNKSGGTAGPGAQAQVRGVEDKCGRDRERDKAARGRQAAQTPKSQNSS